MLGMYGARASGEMYKEFLEALSEAVALGGGLLRPYVVPSTNDPAFLGSVRKTDHWRNSYRTQACTTALNPKWSWGLWGPFLTEYVCWI